MQKLPQISTGKIGPSMIIDDISIPKEYDLEFPQKSVSTFPTVATYISNIDTSFATILELNFCFF